MKSNVKIYNNSNLDTKVVGYGGSTIPIKIYHNSLDYQTGDFFNITFSVNDSTMGSLSTLPTPDSQLGYQPVAIRFDGDKVRENDLAKWTVTATPLSGYKFSHWLLNGQKPTDSESYVLRDDTTIQAVFVMIPKATVYFGNVGYGEFFDPTTGKSITELEVDDTYLKFDYDGVYVTVSNRLESTELWAKIAQGKSYAEQPTLYGQASTGKETSLALTSSMPSIVFPADWSLPSGNLNDSYFKLGEGKSQLVTIAYSVSGAKIERDEENNQFILTNSSGDTLVMADTDYGLPPFKELGIAEAPGYSAEIENRLSSVMRGYGPLAYVPGWDIGLSKINDMQPGETYFDINSTHTLKDWSDIGAAALTVDDYNFLQSMNFYMPNMWYDAKGNQFGQQSDLMLCLNISPRVYAIELRGDLINGEPVRSSALEDNTTVYIPSDFYFNGKVMCQINNGHIQIRNIQASIDSNMYMLDCPGRIRLRGK